MCWRCALFLPDDRLHSSCGSEASAHDGDVAAIRTCACSLCVDISSICPVQSGKTKFAIENSTRTRIVLADTRIHILGSFQNIRMARCTSRKPKRLSHILCVDCSAEEKQYSLLTSALHVPCILVVGRHG
jgi:hypothetical protein